MRLECPGRPPGHAALFGSADCPALRHSHAYSLGVIEALGNALDAAHGRLHPVLTVAAAGSLGRLEATAQSDLDCIVVLRDGCARDSPETDAALACVFEQLAASGLRQPKAWGIYRTPIARGDLLDPATAGSLDEAPQVFGKRLQLLLDARPLYAAAAFAELRRQVLCWYDSANGAPGAAGQWTHLINDLVRYLHAYAVWQQFKFERTSDDSWALRQAKLRGSRVLTVAGLLFLAGESGSQGGDRFGWLLERLDLSPLERLAAVFRRHGADFEPLVRAYELLHRCLGDAATRAALIHCGPAALTDMPLRKEGVFAEVHTHTDKVMSALLDFVWARRGQWAEDYFRYLIF